MKAKRFILIFFISVILLTVLVSALDFEYSARQIITWIQQIFGPFIEPLVGASQFDQYFFARVLLLILTYTIVLSVLKKTEIFKKSPFVNVIISAVVSILGTRYISESALINGILMPYGALAIAISVAVPFLIYFFFVNFSISSGAGRRLAWALFAVVFFGLWMMRVDAIGDANIIYWIGIIATVIVFIFDRNIHVYFELWQLRGLERTIDDKTVIHLLDEIDLAEKIYAQHGNPEAGRRIELLKERLREKKVKGF